MWSIRHRAGAARARAAARFAAGLLLLVVPFALTGLATLYLKHVSERSVHSELRLQKMAVELNAQEALEWQAISGREAPDDVRAEFEASRARLTAVYEHAHGLSADIRHQLDRLLAEYANAVDGELRLLDSGAAAAAADLDEAVVDPAFEAASGALAAQAARLSDRSAQARGLSDAGLLATLGLALGVTAFVQRRVRAADVRRRIERQSDARYRTLIDRSTDLVIVTDRAGQVSFLSPSAERLLTPCLGRHVTLFDVSEVVHPDDRAALRQAIDDAAGQAEVVVELQIRSCEGWRAFEFSVRDLSADPAVGGVVLSGRDVHDRKTLQQELEHRALHDGLTGLPNRVRLGDRLDRALRAAAGEGLQPALLLIDLDRFKDVNDTLGHHIGDALLVEVGRRLAASVRGADTVARLGGDEFAVLLHDVADLHAAVGVAEKLLEALTGSFLVEGADLDVEASIGVALATDPGVGASTLMQHADIAMYQAKQQKIGVATYQPSRDLHSPERLALLGDLRRALEHDGLRVWYQPEVDLVTGRVSGAEALVRWTDPVRGEVPPAEFIPLAENTGLIRPLTRHVLDAALAQARRWIDAGRPLQVAVNLSARSLVDEKLDAVVAQLLAHHQVPPELLKLEITESAIMLDPSHATRLLTRLDALDVAISIDDFGSGYTSLGHLRDLPVSELKIDRSFVRMMSSKDPSAVIVRSVIDLGHRLGMTVVAEGVEDAVTLQQLTDLGCDLAQGFHLTPPLDVGAFDAWRRAWHDRRGLPVRAPVWTASAGRRWTGEDLGVAIRPATT